MALLERKYEIGFLYTADPLGPAFRPILEGIRVSRAMQGTNREEALKQIKEWCPDVIFLHGNPCVKLEKLLVHKYPMVCSFHDYTGGACATGQKCYKFPDWKICKLRLGFYCLALNYLRRCGGLNPMSLVRNYINQSEKHRLLKCYDKVVVNGHYLFSEYLRQGVSPDRLEVAYYPNASFCREDMRTESKKIQGRVLYMGRLTLIKGARYLIKALPLAGRKLDRKLKLIVMGTGPEYGAVNRLAKESGIDIEFKGWVNDIKKSMEIIRTVDLQCLPSLWPEPLSISGIETSAMGVPTAAYDVGGNSEWIRPGTSGELAPSNPPTAEGLAEAIVRALEDEDHFRALCKGALDEAKRFTMDKHLAVLEKIFNGIKRTR